MIANLKQYILTVEDPGFKESAFRIKILAVTQAAAVKKFIKIHHGCPIISIKEDAN